MKKYLFPSLENQSCKNFIWILKLRDKDNIIYIKSLLNFTSIFEKDAIYEKDIRNYKEKLQKYMQKELIMMIEYIMML